MLCRAVLTVAAVSYLICVLILSGLQKEELDVNMLQKLQRHGLDINDMNNERLREECLRSVNATEEAESTKSEIEAIISITENTLNTQLSQQQSKLSSDGSNKTMIESFLKYFLDLQKLHNKTKQKNIEERSKSIIFENYNIPQSSNLKYIFSDTLGYNSPPLKKLDIQPPTTEGVFHLFSQNIIQLWNTYNKQDTKEIRTSSEPTTSQTTTLKPLEKRTNNYDQEMQYVQKLFADYISKNPISTTTSLPSTREIDMDAVSDVIRRFIANAKSDPQNNINKTVQLIEHSTNKQSNDRHIDERRDNFSKYIESNVKNGTSLPYQTENLNNESSGAVFNNQKLLNDNNHINTVNNLYASMQKGIKQKIENKKVMPNDLIKELAESVKELVLRDLKKELSTIIPKTSPLKTEKSSTVTPNVVTAKISEPNIVMEKIMELFQQIKSIKEKTIITGNSKIKVTEKKDIHHEYKGPAKVIYSYKPIINPYGIKSPTEQIAPIFVKQYNREPSIHNNNQAPNIQNPMYQVQQIDNYDAKNGLRLAPITIQTNSFEIAPLNIPILKPLGMVNQNIIVTTESPNRRPRLDTHHSNYIRHIDRYKLEDDFRTRNGWHKPSPSSERLYNSHRHDYDTPKVDNHNNDYKRDYYKPHFTKSDYDHMRLRNQEMKRFHERLEQYDEPRSAEDKEDCCKLKVASRQQLPLSEAKKRPRFDDIHFRNFLKTQQKVNDMLEKILATKTKSDGPRSVETT